MGKKQNAGMYCTAAIGLCLALSSAAHAIDLVITTTVNFSALDGSANDEDGAADDILTVTNLTVRSVGAIVVDDPTAYFIVGNNVVLQNSGAIRGPAIVADSSGPYIYISAGGAFTMTGDSLVRSHGKDFGGRIDIRANGAIELSQRAKIEAHSTTVNGVGGLITLFTPGGTIKLLNSTNRVTANGANGGSVSLISYALLCPAITINSTVNAVGFKGDGGDIVIYSRSGGTTFLGDPFRTSAVGSLNDGTIVVKYNGGLTPDPAPTNPPAMQIDLGDICDAP